MARCFCTACRAFHASAFACYLRLQDVEASSLLSDLEKGEAAVGRLAHTCEEVGVVDRLFCSRCYSVLASLPLSRPRQPLVALGSVSDTTIPPSLGRDWAERFEEWRVEERAPWWHALPRDPAQPLPSHRQLRGGCVCGACRFTALSGREFQIQHCYCKLCRSLSGSVGQTWVPVRPDGFKWTRERALILKRTTGHGSRHVCTECGVVMSIVYDSQPDCIWPVAGVIDDDSMPEDVGAALCRAIHICCSMKQSWYQLPDDGLPRLKYAG